jgi:hypothetical protein
VKETPGGGANVGPVHRSAYVPIGRGLAVVALFLAACFPGRPAVAASSLSVLPADGQTVKLRLTGDRQTLGQDQKFNTLLTLQRTGDHVAVTSAPESGTPLPGDARILADGSLLIDVGDLAVQLNAVTLASTVAVKAPVPITLVSTWNVRVPVVVAGARVTVPVSVIVSDAAASHTALSAQGNAKAQLPGKDGAVAGNVSVTSALTFAEGTFVSASGTVFTDASPASDVHSVTTWNLAPEK